MEIARTTGHPWTEYDIDLLVQVARQIAIAVENSLSYRELAKMKERLATEKLYLEDEIRFDRHVSIPCPQNLEDAVAKSPRLLTRPPTLTGNRLKTLRSLWNVAG